MSPALPDPGLSPDCARCAGLCCVAPPFARSADFPIDKPASVPCPNLGEDFRCAVHAERQARGFHGCMSFDCFGAGQRVTQQTFGGADWRRDPALAERMFGAFYVLYSLHALLWHLDAACALPLDAPLSAELRRLRDEVAALACGDDAALRALALGPLRAEVDQRLAHASALVRADAKPVRAKRVKAGANLLGAKLGGADLRGADLHGACLIGADLAGADLRGADLRGVDLRGADLRGADLRGSLFLTRAQLSSARGDAHTRLDASTPTPERWGVA